MTVTYNGVRVYYHFKGGEGMPVILLHGWGGSSVSMSGIFNSLARENKTVINIDFPPFGESGEPYETFTVYDYCKAVELIMETHAIVCADIVGHSFGGRVALLLASVGKCNKLILTAGAGLKPRRGIKYYLKVFSYKLKKRLGLKTVGMGSKDYQKLSPSMKKVFSGVVNTHLDYTLEAISSPTLLIWGDEDHETPLYMAKKMKKKIRDCELIVFQKTGHYAYIERFYDFIIIMNSFFYGG